jgi:hypothetical protein
MSARRVFSLFVLASSVLFASSTSAAEGTVLYVTGSSYYVDAGRDAGIEIGDAVELWRDGAVVGHLVVRHLSSSRAACEVIDGPPPAVGDSIHYRTRATTAKATPAALASGSRDALYGSFALQQQLFLEQGGFGDDLYRPALEARVEGRSVRGRPLDVLLDARAHRSIYSSGPDESRTRVYRLEATWKFANGATLLRAGRQRQPDLPTLGSFDGLGVEFRADRRLGFGVAAGTQPEPENLAVFGDVQEAAAYLRSTGALGRGRWKLNLAAVGSYESSEISREYLVARTNYRDALWWLSLLQEFDIYRGWRSDVESQSVGATSRYASVRRRFGHRASVSAGFDSRRNVRIYRDRETPESAFDDRYRNGAWGAFQVGIGRGAALSMRLRTRNGTGAGSMESQTLQLQRVPIKWTSLRAGLRTTHYDNPFVEGWLGSLSVEGRQGEIDGQLEFGLRDDDAKNAALSDDLAWWVSAEAEARLSARWSATLVWDHYGGSDDSREIVYSGLRYRF